MHWIVRAVASDKASAFAASVVRSLGRVGVGVLVARTTDTTTFAVYVVLAAAETIVAAVMNASITMPLITLVPGRSEHEAGALVAVARRQCGRWAMIFGVGCGVGAAWLLRVSVVEACVFGGSVAGASLASTSRALLQARFRARRLLVAECAFVGVVVSVCVIARVAGQQMSGAVVWGAFAAAWGVVLLIVHRRETVVCDAQAMERARAMVQGVARPMLVGSIGVSASTRVQPMVLAWAGNAAAVSAFGAAQTLTGPIRLLSMSLSGVLRPRLALHACRGDAVRFKQELVTNLAPVVIGGVLGTLVLAIGGKGLVALVFGSSMQFDAWCLPALGVYATLEAVGAMLTVAVQTLEERGARRATVARLWCAALGLVVMWPLARYVGPGGLACGLAGVEVVFVLSLGVGSSRRAVAGESAVNAGALGS